MIISKDKKLPDTWLNFTTDEHRYIGIPFGVTRKCEYEIYLCDDSTLNQMNYLFSVKGNKHKAAHSINQYEIQQIENKKAIQKLIKEGM